MFDRKQRIRDTDRTAVCSLQPQGPVNKIDITANRARTLLTWLWHPLYASMCPWENQAQHNMRKCSFSIQKRLWAETAVCLADKKERVGWFVQLVSLATRRADDRSCVVGCLISDAGRPRLLFPFCPGLFFLFLLPRAGAGAGAGAKNKTKQKSTYHLIKSASRQLETCHVPRLHMASAAGR